MDPLPPDPYAALDVPRDASSAAIKTAYRKLALKYHPDKAKDKGDEFHRVQQAYELIGEDEPRRKYDDLVRLAGLRKDVFSRRGSGYGPNVDVRSNPSPGAGFQARGPPTYEERRPNPATTGGSVPRSPYAEDEAFDSYFPPPRSGSRKYDGYEASSRKPPSTRAPPTQPAPRAQETREALRREKVNSSKSRNEKKKQRDQEKGRERKGKFATSFASVESDDSDEGFFEAARRRDSQFAEERSRRENRDDFYGDLWSEKLQTQTTGARDYISRAKAEGSPVEKGSPLPQQPKRNTSAQELPIHTRPTPPQEPPVELRRSGRDSRPAMVRKSNFRAKEKTPEPARSAKTPKDTRSKTAERQSPEPLHTTTERRPPQLYTSNSSPESLKIPKSRTVDDLEGQRNVPRMERSTTMPPNTQPPLKRSSTQKGSTTPIVSSNLRHAETNDSGYSTSSPSETPQPQQSTSTTYRYGADAVQVDKNGNEYESVLREPNRPLRRSPSPELEAFVRERERRPALSRDRERGPPSRSASYQSPTGTRKDIDLDRERGPPSRSASHQSPAAARIDAELDWERDSLPRSASYHSPTAARIDPDFDRDPLSSGRRPSMPNRTGSGRVVSSGRTPTLQRGSSSPMPPLRTGGMSNNKDGYLFGEISNSPPDFREPNYSPRSAGGSRFPDDTEGRYGRQFTQEDVRFGSYAQSGRSGYYGGGGSRRVSEDIGRTRAEAAHAYMDLRDRSAPRPGDMKRGSTFVY